MMQAVTDLPKHARVSEDIKRNIFKGLYPGDKIPSESKLQEKYAVCRETIRTALKNLKKSRYIKSRPGYGWDIIKPKKKYQRNKPIIFVASSFDGSYMGAIEHIRTVFRKQGLKSDIVVNKRLKQPIEDLVNMNSAGGFIYLTGVRIPEAHLTIIESHKLPVMCIGLSSEERYDTIAMDNGLATELLLNNLIQVGHKNIALCGIKSGDKSFDARIRAYRKYMDMHKLTPQLFLSEKVWIEDDICNDLAEKVKNGEIDAILTAGGHPSILLHFATKGIKIPSDVSFLPYNLDPDQAVLNHFNVTSFKCTRNPIEKIAKYAADKIMSLLDKNEIEPKMHLLKPELLESDAIMNRR